MVFATLTVGTGVAAALGGLALAGAAGLGALAVFSRRGRRRFGSRKRFGRDVQDEQNALNTLLEAVRLEDVTQCGRKLMCLLAGIPEGHRSPHAEDILGLVGPSMKPGEGVLPPGGAGDYLVAKTFGYLGGNCTREYQTCPATFEQLGQASL